MSMDVLTVWKVAEMMHKRACFAQFRNSAYKEWKDVRVLILVLRSTVNLLLLSTVILVSQGGLQPSIQITESPDRWKRAS